MFDFSGAIAQCEKIVADTLGDSATLTTQLGEVVENVPVLVKTYDQAMGDEGGWSGRYAQSLGNATAESHFIQVPESYIQDFEKGRCTLATGKAYVLVQQIGVDVGFKVYAAIED